MNTASHRGSKITAFINAWIVEEQKNWKDFDELLNQGFCADLAMNIWEEFGRPKDFWFRSCKDPVHTWIEFAGKHYDMQNPEGCSEWKEMEYFKDCPNPILER